MRQDVLPFVQNDPAGALLSPDRLHRYVLTRWWPQHGGLTPTSKSRGTGNFIGLNPSTADELEDDSTIRRCIGFAQREGCGRLVMTNLFSWRATDPAELRRVPKPSDDLNDAFLEQEATMADLVVCAWGGAGARYPERVAEVLKLLPSDLRCLGRTSGGHPRHPLYLAADTKLERYP